MTVRPITTNQAHTKLVRLEDDLCHLIARLKASGFEQAARELGYIVDECLAPVHEALGAGSNDGCWPDHAPLLGERAPE